MMVMNNIEISKTSIKPISSKKLKPGAASWPAGAFPIAEQGEGLICMMTSGRWVLWVNREKHLLPNETQKEVVEVLIRKFGKTSAGLAERIGVSQQRVEVWRTRKAKMTPGAAEEIVKALADR